MSKVFPVGLKVEKKKCLIVGGGIKAYEVATSLLRCGAEVSIISMEPCAKIVGMKEISLQERAFDAAVDTNDIDYIFCTLENPEASAEIAEAARMKNIPVYSKGASAISDFTLPRGSAEHKDFTFAFFPPFSDDKEAKEKRICYKKLSDACCDLQKGFSMLAKSPEKRKELFNFFLGSDFLATVRSKGLEDVKKKISAILESEK